MNEPQMIAERQYYIAMAVANSMHQKGTISPEVLSVIQTNLLKKYKPISATLLSGKPLTI